MYDPNGRVAKDTRYSNSATNDTLSAGTATIGLLIVDEILITGGTEVDTLPAPVPGPGTITGGRVPIIVVPANETYQLTVAQSGSCVAFGNGSTVLLPDQSADITGCYFYFTKSGSGVDGNIVDNSGRIISGTLISSATPPVISPIITNILPILQGYQNTLLVAPTSGVWKVIGVCNNS